MTFRPLRAAAALVALASLPATPALASCGSAFCSLMTDDFAQGVGTSHLGWSSDLRLEAVGAPETVIAEYLALVGA